MPKELPQPMVRGGIAHDVKRIYLSPIAIQQFKELFPDDNIDKITGSITQVKRMADHSDFFLYIENNIRLVFCLERGRPLRSGRFTLVKVQKQKRE